MEQQSQATNDDGILTLATRKCLFRLLSFLDSRLPEYSAIHSFVCAALLTANPSYHVYFRRASSASEDEENYSLIIGLGVECFVQPNQQTKKCWTVTAWTDDDEKLASAYEAINIIDWNTDAVIMHYKFHAPHPAIDNLVKNKHGEGKDNKICYPSDQYFMPVKDALNLQISEIDGVYVKSLERCHAQIVYDYWPYRESTTVENITKEIELLPSAGVFLKGNDQLVSWMMCHPPNGMSRLHTLEEHRRRGYAALVTQYLSKRVAQCGFVPFANIVIENTASYKFFESMKFKHLHPIYVQYSSAALSTANPSYLVYFRRQDMTNTTFISSEDEEDYSVIVGVAKENYLGCNEEVKKCWTMTAWTDSDENLAGAYEAIDEIDWRDDVIVIHYKHHTLHQGLANFLDRERVQGHCYPCDQYVLPTKDAFNLQIGEIDGVYVKSLERCHAQLVYDQWPYRAGSTVEKVAEEIQELPSAGVFLKDNDKLVSWMMYHLPNGMSRLHTLQEYRRRGYAALVTQYLSKRVAQCGFVPFVNVHLENIASYTLFTSTMGFRRLCYGHCYVTSNYPS